MNGDSQTFLADEIWSGRIIFHGLDGNDRFMNCTDFVSDAYGGEGNDTLVGGPGHDVLFGENGDDTLDGDRLNSTGNDELYGGDGNDWLTAYSGGNILGGDAGNDILQVQQTGMSYAVPNMLFGGDGNDGLEGGDGAELMWGGNGDDSLYGNGGDDQLFGENGFDRLYGEDGQDLLNGGADEYVDELWGGSGADTFVLHPGFATDLTYYDSWSDRVQYGESNSGNWGG
jgi:Ca2+-binding RTX toxin-like protein